MSFLPLPGWFIAAMYCRSSQCFTSPRLSLSRKQKPCVSTSWRTISSVGWSPQVFTRGIDTSSKNTVIFLPLGGPNDLPPRLSSSDSIVLWNMPGVVADEKLTRFRRRFSGSNVRKNISATDVLAVPAPPIIRTGSFWTCRASRRKIARVESMVGTSRLEKSRTSVSGYSQASGRQRSHSRVLVSTKYSYMVSPSPTSGHWAGPACLRSFSSNRTRSWGSNRPPIVHVRQYRNKRSIWSLHSSASEEKRAFLHNCWKRLPNPAIMPIRDVGSGSSHFRDLKSNS
mmetsp:Transcript_53887/g.129837  ORF Transcript_53887/g.129837 Transcript_53887/m.129837 type:complete len:284 (-) Transcript_53887:1100-1951(-)